MNIKVFSVVNLGLIIMIQAEPAKPDAKLDFSKIQVTSNLSHFFNNWRLNSEKIQGIQGNSTSDSSLHGENRQKQKELESKLTALQDLYNERNWEPLENEHFFTQSERNARQLPAPLYDSLLTRRTFSPSLKTILIELSLMTLSIVAVNAIESAMAQTKKQPPKKKNSQHRSYSAHLDYTDHE